MHPSISSVVISVALIYGTWSLSVELHLVVIIINVYIYIYKLILYYICISIYTLQPNTIYRLHVCILHSSHFPPLVYYVMITVSVIESTSD